MTAKLVELRHRVNKSKFEGTLIALDPGETTGVTVVHVPFSQDSIDIRHQCQIKSWPLERFIGDFNTMLALYKPEFVVFESYHVYAWRLNEHTFSEVPTIQIIGSLQTLCHLQKIPYGEQTAQTGKAFWTDERLKTFGVFKTGEKHARDSLRHALQYLVFGLKGQ